MSKATKRPWIIKPHHGYKSLKTDIYSSNSPDTLATTGFFGRTDQETEANAELIVRAVNCHDELVKAVDLLFYCYNEGAKLTNPSEIEELLKRCKGEM